MGISRNWISTHFLLSAGQTVMALVDVALSLDLVGSNQFVISIWPRRFSKGCVLPSPLLFQHHDQIGRMVTRVCVQSLSHV